jgi:hypothetical protein
MYGTRIYYYGSRARYPSCTWPVVAPHKCVGARKTGVETNRSGHTARLRTRLVDRGAGCEVWNVSCKSTEKLSALGRVAFTIIYVHTYDR